jgi:glyceraldehyde-3-phosphate dehydrogenase (NADP+)
MPLLSSSPWTFELREREEIPALEEILRQGMERLSALPLFERVDRVRALEREIFARRDSFQRLITEEVAKPPPLAEEEVRRALLLLQLVTSEAMNFPWEERQTLERTSRGRGRFLVIRRIPVGPLLAITPFNFPLNLPMHKIAPALVCGLSVALKPAPQAPRTAGLLGECVHKAGFDEGALVVVLISNELAESLVEEEFFGILSFTGSARVGWKLKRKSPARKVILELGGNAGVIVEPDADLAESAKAIARGGFAFSGQVCISVQRVFAHKRIYPEFRDLLITATENLPREELLSPIISEGEAERIRDLIRSALKSGARMVLGGLGHSREIPPTILENVPHTEPLWREEVFGPIITLEPYEDLDQALSFLNDSSYGLQSALFTRNISTIERVFARADVGAVIVNDATTFRADEMPFGGRKRSGIGREGPRWLFLEYTEPRTLVVRW